MSAKRALKLEETFDANEIRTAIRLSHQAKFGKAPRQRELSETTAQIIEKPMQMPQYLREWLKSPFSHYHHKDEISSTRYTPEEERFLRNPPGENSTINWLAQFV